MFTGVGGFELGIGNKGECVGFSENNKHCNALLKRRFPGVNNYEDCTTIKPEILPEFDLLCGGFPCQSFSIAGKRRGFEDTRGTMFFHIARILKIKRPKYLLLENVKGLLNHDKGKTFSTILQTLEELGYDIQWMVLNSKFHGVPQNRERVFIIGSIRELPRPEILPIGCCNQESNEQNGEGNDTAHTIQTSDKHRGSYIKSASQGNRVYDSNGVSSTIGSSSGGLGAKTGLYAIPVLTPDRLEKRQNGRRFKEEGDPSFTITKTDIHGVSIGTRIRRLTPLECERLQGFPDNWTAGFSDTQRYKMMGNAVTVNVIKVITDKLWNSLKKTHN